MKKSRTGWNKLKKLVKDRDNSLKLVYMEMLGLPFPMGDTEVHHVRPHGEGGADREENLITLDVWIHRTQFHTSMGHAEPLRQRESPGVSLLRPGETMEGEALQGTESGV